VALAPRGTRLQTGATDVILSLEWNRQSPADGAFIDTEFLNCFVQPNTH